MGRRPANARAKPRGGGFRLSETPESEGKGLSSPLSALTEAVTSLKIKERASAAVDSGNKAGQDVRRFAKAVIGLWAQVDAPHLAAYFWRQAGTDPAKKDYVPPHLGRDLGQLLGWAVIEHRKPVELGGKEAEAVSIFSPLRRDAGQLARTALVAACGNEQVFDALSQPVPSGVMVASVQTIYGYQEVGFPRNLGVRLADYPPEGTSMSMRLGAQQLLVGYNIRPSY